MMCRSPGADREIDLTWLDFSESRSLSDDGRLVLFTEGGAGGGARGAVYLRKTDGGSPAIRLADGENARGLSPDAKRFILIAPDKLTLTPVGPGEPKTIQDEGFRYRLADWFPDGETLMVNASAQDHPVRAYARAVSHGPPRPLTPEGTLGFAISPDGKTVLGVDRGGRASLFPVEGGEPRPVPAIAADDGPLRFDATGRGVFLAKDGPPLRIDHLDLASGKRTLWKELQFADPTGARTIARFQLTPDGKSYCYSFVRALSRLYVVEGLR